MKYWYHGTPDVRELEKKGFISRNQTVDYIKNLEGYYSIQTKIKQARENGDEDLYFNLLDQVKNFKEKYKFRKPVFLTNVYNVAKTYANPKRALDYQNATEKVLKVVLDEGSLVTINATGDRFRFISIDKVKKGFINSGISSDKINEMIEKLTFYQQDKLKIKTDSIAVLGEWFGFDYIDVIGVLDSYEGGSIKSTVRMVFDTSKIKIVDNIMEENRSIIKKLIKEHVNLSVTDETPESISVLVQYNERNAGIITVIPSPEKEDMLELVNMKFKKDYEELHIIKDAINNLWSIFPNYNSIIVAPKKESITFYNKLGFNRISKNYLISNRGH